MVRGRARRMSERHCGQATTGLPCCMLWLSHTGCAAVTSKQTHPAHPLPSPDRLVCLRAMSSNSLRPSGFCACAARSSYRSLGAEASKGMGGGAVRAGEIAVGCPQRAQQVREDEVGCSTWNKMSWATCGHGPPGRPCPTELQRNPGGVDSGKVLFSKGPPRPEGRPPPLLFQCRAAGAVWCTT